LRLCADGIVTRGSAYFIILTLAASLFASLAFVYVERFAIKASNSFFAFIDGLYKAVQKHGNIQAAYLSDGFW
jgi:hypothetical protein